MIRFENLFKNFFDNKNISDDTLKQFTQDHIGKLTANNSDNRFDSILTESREVYNDYFGSINQENITATERKASTLTTNNLLKEFKQFVRRHEGLIRSKYGKDSATYIEFFPHGMDEYHSASKKNIEVLMNRFANATKTHQSDLGIEIADSMMLLLDNYTATRNNQLDKKGSLSNKKSTTARSRAKLELQLCKNLFTIGAIFPGNTSKCMSFFDQSIIRPRHNSARDGHGRAIGKITANGLPIVGAMVSYEGVKQPANRSKTDGSYKARNVAIGMHQLKVSAPGYKIFTGKIIIKDAGETVMDVMLESE